MKKLPVQLVDARKKYVLFDNDCGLTDMTRRGGMYEHYIFDYIRNNLSDYIKGKTILDIGANFGLHSMEFADLVGEEGKVYSFEPQRIVFYQLCANVILNGYSNIYCNNVGIGESTCVLKMENPDYHSKDTVNIGDSHLNAFTNNFYNEVEVKPLDFYQFKNVGIIKIDVQGYEAKVLDGAKKTIEQNKPIIFIEIEEPQLRIYGHTSDDIFSRLLSMGYTFRKVMDAPHLVDYIATPM